MNRRALAALCILALLVAFAIDLVTPQLFVVAILLDVPIVLSTFAGNRRLTAALVVAALLANMLAGYINGAQAGGVWDLVGLADRALAALSIILVGLLGLAVHRSAERSGAATALVEEAQRERALREAAETIRGSLSEELVERAIARQARELLDASRASFFVAAAEGGWTACFEAARGRLDIVQGPPRPRGATHSILVRSLEAGEPAILSADGEMTVTAPLIDAGTPFGVLLLAFERNVGADEVRILRSFAQGAAVALRQARLFVELAQKNDELAQQAEVIRDILYALSHDLRTPLAAAGLTLRQAQQGAYGAMPPQYGEILKRSIEANDELQRLAETLLLVARYEAGERTVAHRPVDLAKLVREVTLQLASLAKSKDLRVEVSAPLEALVNGDQAELRRAIVNLFANAVTWSRSGGAIAVGVDAGERFVRVEVADEGFGVPEEIRDALFMRFGGNQKRGGGTGLGLYIVRRIAEEHGGRVRYEPNPAQGSIFSLELPALRLPLAVSS